MPINEKRTDEMGRVLKRAGLALLLLSILYVLAVQVLRWSLVGEQERAALALLTAADPPQSGVGGYKYFGLAHLRIPREELDAALEEDVVAYRRWLDDLPGTILASDADAIDDIQYVSPLDARYPPQSDWRPIEPVCGLGEWNCLRKLRDDSSAARELLRANQEALALMLAAFEADHLESPYPLSAHMPFGPYRYYALPLNAFTIQALDGDVPGALAAACRTLAAERRFLGQHGMLIDVMVQSAATLGMAGLVLELRRNHPEVPWPEECAMARAPIQAKDYALCPTLKKEFQFITTTQDRIEAERARRWRPDQLARRLLLEDAELAKAWVAMGAAPYCTEAGQLELRAGRLPAASPPPGRPWVSLAFWSAPWTHSEVTTEPPTWDFYQERLLDQAAILRLQLAAMAAYAGELPVEDVARVGASAGYEISSRCSEWVLPLRRPSNEDRSEYRVARPGPACDRDSPAP